MKQLDPFKIKKRIMDIGLATGCGHVPSALSIVSVLCDTYNTNPDAIIIVSKGHGVLAQYVILNELGKLPDEVLDTYHKDGGLSEHSTYMSEYGVYASTGSLGHGLGIGIGYAIANPKKQVIVIMSDGELDEGSTLESLRIMLKLNVSNLLPVVDVNGYQGFSKFDPNTLRLLFKSYYSIKGESLGEKWEDKVDAHYAKVDQETYDHWMNVAPGVEAQRAELKKQANILKNKNESNRKSTSSK